MAEACIKLEIDIAIYELRDSKKKWWQFWKPKIIRVLMSYDEIGDKYSEALKEKISIE